MLEINLLENVIIDAIKGCWNYRFVDREGYGRYRKGQKELRAHRVAAMLWLGFDIQSKLLVCHHCDNPRCVNPVHLFIGTDLDNRRDAWAKGRMKPVSNKGIKNGHAKLTEADVKAIREAYRKGVKQIILAKQYNVSDSAIHGIVKFQRWKHI